jgi:hypothetical protein
MFGTGRRKGHGYGLRGRRLGWVLILAPALSVAGILGVATPGQAMTTGAAQHAATAAAHPGVVKPNKVNMLDCNGYSSKYTTVRPGSKALCTDPVNRHGVKINGKWHSERFEDNGHYIGHDEPSVKFISNKPGSGNTMSYLVRLPVDPQKAATPSGSVTKYGELSIAPWFGLPMCDPKSYPQKPCTPDSDTNTGLGARTDAGSAFMELQFYAPGFTPFASNISCDNTKWCARLTIDSLAATFNFKFINPACTEPVNAAFLQRNGVPTGPPSPQLSNLASFTPNAQTLMMNPGDVLRVSISDPAAGFTTRVTDLTTGQTGFMTASAANGFMNTNVRTCNGTPFTFHAEYDTAAQQNQVPWGRARGRRADAAGDRSLRDLRLGREQLPANLPRFRRQRCVPDMHRRNRGPERHRGRPVRPQYRDLPERLHGRSQRPGGLPDQRRRQRRTVRVRQRRVLQRRDPDGAGERCGQA